MASGKDKKSSTEQHIYQYYKKISQNKNLPKYFSGSPLSYLPEFNDDFDKKEEGQIFIKTDVDIVVTNYDEDLKLQHSEDQSRTSSAMSNRKLEWDNLADIGYENSQHFLTLKRSSSLPILTEMEPKRVNFNLKTCLDNPTTSQKITLTDISNSGGDTPPKNIELTSLSSSEEEKKIQKYSTSSSSKQDEIVSPKNLTSTSTSSSEKAKKPEAYSTSSSEARDERVTSFAKTLSYLKKKIGLPDAQSTPNSVSDNSRNIEDAQSTPTSNRSNKSKIPDLNSSDSSRYAKNVKSPPTSNRSSTSKKAISKQTEPRPVQKTVNLCLTKPISIECFSFKIEPETKLIQKKIQCCNVSVQTDNIPEKELEQLVKLRGEQNQSIVYVERSESDKNTCSTQTCSEATADSFDYIENKQKDELTDDESSTEDLEKKIYLMERLIKSRKYDEATKKRYLKKILKKITESKYLNDSSASSDLFFPKKGGTIPEKPTLPTSSTNSSSSSQKGILKKTRPFKKPLEVINSTVNVNVGKDSSSGSSSNYQNWKEDKTASEKRLEHFNVNVVDQERRYQLKWINSEMDHLQKLKQALEKPETPTTSVYVVSEDSDSGSNREKKFVIQTQINGSSKPSKRTFHLEGRKYTVNEISNNENEACVIRGEIQVVTDDKTTNIRVTTFCDICKRSPCVCVTDFLNCRTNPFEVAPENVGVGSSSICIKCHKILCICYDKATRSGLRSYEGKFIPAAVPLEIRNQMEESSKSGSCVLCGEKSCYCEEQAWKKNGSNGKSSSSSGKYGTPEMSDNSLKRVFKFCKCNIQRQCNCEFVDKVYKHLVQSRNGHHKTRDEDIKIDFTRVPVKERKIDTEHLKITRKIEEKLENEQSTDYKKHTDDIPKILKTNRENIPKPIIPRETVADMREETVQTREILSNKIVQVDTRNYYKETSDKATETSFELKKMSTQTEHLLSQASALVQTDSILVKCKPAQTATFVHSEIQTENVPVSHKVHSTGDIYKNTSSQTSEIVKKSQYTESDLLLETIQDAEIQAENVTEMQQKPSPILSDISEVSQVSQRNEGEEVQKMEQFEVIDKDDSESKHDTVSRSSTNGTTISTTTTSSTTVPCICCKRPVSYARAIILCHNQEEYYFCRNCVQKKPILTTICYMGPEHVCQCYDVEPVKLTTESSRSSRSRTQSIPEPSKMSDYCTCTKPSKPRHMQYCLHCQNKLRRTLKNNNGIAYTLTLEDETPRKQKRSKACKDKLEEIKIKVPSKGHNKKKFKDEANLSKKNGSLNLNLEKKSKNGNGSNRLKSYLTLQEYLKKNRPDFIDSAEYRRIAVLHSKIGRELVKDEEKLKLLEKKFDNKNKLQKETKLFSEKEMREITKRNYKKLPEVQRKVHYYQEQKLRSADKVMVNVLNKKIQGSVLKGKSRFPIDSKVVKVK